MTIPWWTQTENDATAAERRTAFWRELHQQLTEGRFWSEEIKALHGDPPARLEKALSYLPLPAAFREGAKALRAIIRQKRKASQPYDDELALLYWLAALDSFRLSFSERLQQPGFNVVEIIPGERLFDLTFSYEDLGYRELSLLTKTDVKWLRHRFGEPTRHTTLNALHPDTWREYEDKLAQAQGRW